MNNLSQDIHHKISQYLHPKDLINIRGTCRKNYKNFSKDYVLQHNAAVIIQKNTKRYLNKKSVIRNFFQKILNDPKYRLGYFYIHEPNYNYNTQMINFSDETHPHVCLQELTPFLERIFENRLFFTECYMKEIDENIQRYIIEKMLELHTKQYRQKWLSEYIFKN